MIHTIYHQVRRPSLWYALLLGIMVSSSGCFKASKDLGKSEYLLDRQSVEGNKTVSSSKLESRFRQKQNRRLFGIIPYAFVEVYYWGKKSYNKEKLIKKRAEESDKYVKLLQKYEGKTKKMNKIRNKRDRRLRKLDRAIEEGNWLMRAVGEPPAIFELNKAKDTQEDIKLYLQTKGFFDASVKIHIDTTNFKKKLIKATYTIEENTPTKIRKVQLLTSNKTIDSLATAHPFEIEEGDRYDRDVLDSERTRLETLLKNNGYFHFSRDYIQIEVDTSTIDTLHHGESMKKKIADIHYIINNPQKVDTSKYNQKLSIGKIPLDEIKGEHIRYKINDVYFLVMNDHRGEIDTLELFPYSNDPKYTTVKYTRKSLRFSPKIIDTRIFLRPEMVYDESKQKKTQAGIFNLNMFRATNILMQDDKNGSLSPIIIGSPFKKYALTNELGLNVTQGLPGPYINFSLKNRNTFGGCEIFENTLTFSIDGQTSLSENSKVYSSTEVSFNSSIILPQIFLPSRLKHKFDHLNPKTRFNLGINFIRRNEYTRKNYNLSMIYSLQKIPTRRINFTPIDINIVETDMSHRFTEELDRLSALGSTLKYSFINAIVSSSHGYYEYSDIHPTKVQKANYFKVFGEVGGATLGLLKETKLNTSNKIFGLTYYKFLKASLDYRRYIPLSQHSMLVARISLGGVTPYDQSEAIPYEKYFFGGGGNSIRAWAPRRLGPGSYDHLTKDGGITYQFEQPGNVSFETNIEYRTKLWRFINYALFADIGNVWTIREEEFRQGSKLKGDSWKDMAVGTGMGLRFDFTFLIFRLDMGIKTIDPSKPQGKRWVFNEAFNRPRKNPNNPIIFNLGIGYPF